MVRRRHALLAQRLKPATSGKGIGKDLLANPAWSAIHETVSPGSRLVGIAHLATTGSGPTPLCVG
jgi:hypothetical protein